METIKQISVFLKSNASFEEQTGAQGRRYHFVREGEKVAYVWFKYALGGWNMIIGKEKERHYIDSVEKVKTLLSL
jgi:uncharacterized protein YkuJ